MDQKDERLWGALAHVIPLVVSYSSSAGWIAALVMYFIFKDRSRFVAFNALQVLYFHALLFVAVLVSIPLMFVLVGFLILAVVAVAALVLTIIGAIKASNGEVWEYPVVGKWARSTVGI